MTTVAEIDWNAERLQCKQIDLGLLACRSMQTRIQTFYIFFYATAMLLWHGCRPFARLSVCCRRVSRMYCG